MTDLPAGAGPELDALIEKKVVGKQTQLPPPYSTSLVVAQRLAMKYGMRVYFPRGGYSEGEYDAIAPFVAECAVGTAQLREEGPTPNAGDLSARTPGRGGGRARERQPVTPR